jgi:1,4-dihydroxy-2-naphthoyl-CoA synthase
MGLVDQIAENPAAVQSTSSWWRRRAVKHVDAPDPMIDARAFARTLTLNAPLSIAGAKTILNGLALGQAAVESPSVRHAVLRAAASNDYREGRAAFSQRRTPMFTGQ